MVDPSLRVLQVNSVDAGGGAAKIAMDLFRAYHQRGHESWMVVGAKHSSDALIRELDHDPYRKGLPGLLGKVWRPFRKFEPAWPGVRTLHRRILLAVDIERIKNRLMGKEDFEFPGSVHLLDLTPKRPDILHFHNLHGDYFDLRELAILSQQVPAVLTLHDAWLLSGHCGHSFDCERWQTGCGDCPDLTIPPPIRRDSTAFNWQRKQEIFSRSRLFLVTPSCWLMQKVEKSILAKADIENKVIPNGVDLSIFQPASKEIARAALKIPVGARVLLFCANDLSHNPFKDYKMLRNAIALLDEPFRNGRVLLIVLGEDGQQEKIGGTEIRFEPYQKDPKVVARYYHAADVTVHTSRMDTFPTTILESLACGTPVVATAVGGIPEQIADGETGFLVPPGDALTLAHRIEQILRDNDLRTRMGRAAADLARRSFDLERMADTYLNWYEAILRVRQDEDQE